MGIVVSHLNFTGIYTHLSTLEVYNVQQHHQNYMHIFQFTGNIVQ